MSDAIIVALITGGLSLIGVVITCLVTARKNETAMKVAQAVTDTKIEELTREVRLHNGFAQRMPVVEQEIKEIRDTLASLRLDSVISSGFRIGRSLATQYVNAGKAAIDGLPCEKPDKAVVEGCKIAIRGLGKIKLATVGGQTKKGRISVVIHRYI